MSWFKRSKAETNHTPDCTGSIFARKQTWSILYDERTFYNRFTQDLLEAKEEVIIESPFITTKRINMLRPHFEKLIHKGVKVFVFTRPPEEHEE